MGKTNIRIKRVYADAVPEDGARILVDRLWPRGLSKDDADLALWLKDIAPTTSLRTWFHRDPTQWDEFRRRYRAELDDNPGPVEQLIALANKGPLTLLYAARDEAHNHAVVLADYLTSVFSSGARRTSPDGW